MTLQETVNNLSTSQEQRSEQKASTVPKTLLLSSMPEALSASPEPKAPLQSAALMASSGAQQLSSKGSGCTNADDGKVSTNKYLFKDNHLKFILNNVFLVSILQYDVCLEYFLQHIKQFSMD